MTRDGVGNLPKTSQNWDAMAIASRVGLVVTTALFILFATSLMATKTDQRHYITVVRQAVEDGTLAKRTFLPFAPGTPLFAYNLHDCIILTMLVIPPRGTILQRAISPLIPVYDGASELPTGYPPYFHCQYLSKFLIDRTLPSEYYHRYLHGDWVLSAALLSFLSFRTATNFLLFTLCSALAATVIISARSAWLGPTATRKRDLAFLALSSVLAAFYALPVFGRSLSFAPSDIVLVCFVLFAYLKPLSHLTETQYVTAVTAFGSLTAIFEFMIGAIPSGAAVLLAMVALDPSSDRALLHRRTWLGLLCFFSAIALLFAGKAIVVAAIWGWSEIASAGAELGRQAGSRSWDIAAENVTKLQAFGISLNADVIKSSRALTTLFALSKVVYFSSIVGLGSRALGIVLVVILPALLVVRCWTYRRYIEEDHERSREALILFAAATVPLWYLVFPTHTIILAPLFMVRPMVWPLAILVAREVWRIDKMRHNLSGVRS
jgi:hypothetical protein